ncbi:MAG: nicotinate-nucleotide adenylyltransferase [Clostridia bacterium]|nr:nicotinate-nucleotide adenylyltransferase [Clostridia bacterium]
MKKLGIMGGTFNPIHKGHIAVAQAALDEFGLDRIMFLPNYQPPHKKCEADAELRLEMTRAAVDGNEKFFVSDFEISKGGISYSADTLKAFREIYPNCELYFIIGGDSLRDFTKWYKPGEIVKNCILLAYPRNDINLKLCMENLKKSLNARVFELCAPEIDISSSRIRELVQAGESIEKYVPRSVTRIIEKNNLYKG